MKYKDFQLGDIISMGENTYVFGASKTNECNLIALTKYASDVMKSDDEMEDYLTKGKAELRCHYITSKLIHLHSTLVCEDNNGKISIEKCIEYPNDIYTRHGLLTDEFFKNADIKSNRMIFYYPLEKVVCGSVHISLSLDKENFVHIHSIKSLKTLQKVILYKDYLAPEEVNYLSEKVSLSTVNSIDII